MKKIPGKVKLTVSNNNINFVSDNYKTFKHRKNTNFMKILN